MSYVLPEGLVRQILENTSSPYIFLETGIFDKNNKTSFLFSQPDKIIIFSPSDNVGDFFKEIESLLNDGYWLVGYFSYDFSFFLEPKLHYLKKNNSCCFPLVWLGAFRKPRLFYPPRKPPILLNDLKFSVEEFHYNMNFEEYRRALEKIKYYLAEGETYEVNYTFKLKFFWKGNICDLYIKLRREQPTSYMAFLDIGDGEKYVLSFSPELFFRLNNRRIVSRPMKGTISRGRFHKEDMLRKRILFNDQKTQAENLMIVDMLRNDIGKLSEPGSVIAEELFCLERYRSLYQMTSAIQGKIRRGVGVKEIFMSLFPCASITGAPKIRTMEIINSLEKENRGVYTGCIGYMNKDEMCFNVAIRTLCIEGNKGELGIGGGIVYDSVNEKEFEEAKLKSHFFIKQQFSFSLIETLKWEKGYYLLDLHLQRLRESCDYFQISLDLHLLKERLALLETKFSKDTVYKIRVLVNIWGGISVDVELLDNIIEPVRITISDVITNPKDQFLYHKTTNRYVYDNELKKARAKGFFDIIFTNNRGEITEGAISNIFMKKGEKMYTPPVESGLLNGVLRRSMVETKKVKERTMCLNDLLEADEIFIGNSVRGLLRANLCMNNVDDALRQLHNT